jgi:hypothetical protein
MANQRSGDVWRAIAHREVKCIIFSCTSCEAVMVLLLIAAINYLKTDQRPGLPVAQVLLCRPLSGV